MPFGPYPKNVVPLHERNGPTLRIDAGQVGHRWCCGGILSSLIDLLQNLNFWRRTVRVVVQGDDIGAIDFVDGEIVHAEVGALTGEEALRAMLAAPPMEVTMRAPTDAPRTIRSRFRELLLATLEQLEP